MKAKILKIDYLENNITFNILGDLSEFKDNDLFELKKVRRKRTLNTNALYWLFNSFVGMNLGMAKEEVHSGFAEAFLSVEKEINGKKFKTVRSTADLDQQEFSIYLDRCNLMALDYGVDTSGFWEEYERFKKN